MHSPTSNPIAHPDLETVMQRLEARISARSSHQRVSSPPPTPPSPSAHLLFATGATHQRPYLERAILLLPGVGPLVYQGQRLAADDQAVWRALLLRFDRTPHNLLVFPSLGLLRVMGWGQSRHDRLRLRHCLERLQAAWVRRPEDGANLPLLLGCQWQALASGRSDRWQVKLSPAIRQVFAHWEALSGARVA